MATLTPQKRSGGRRSVIGSLPAEGEAGFAIGDLLSSRGGTIQLIAPEEAERILRDGDVVLIEARFFSVDHPGDPGECHIPGAIELHPSYLESGTDQAKYYPNYQRPEDGNLLPARELHLALERIGIGPDTQVVIYGDGMDGTMAASRVAWGLLYAGVTRVSMLDGGLGAWRACGGATVSTLKSVCDVTSVRHNTANPASGWRLRSHYLATHHEVRNVAGAAGRGAGAKLVDVRRRTEWDGAGCQPYPFFNTGGRIPSAVYQGEWTNLLDPVTLEIGASLGQVASRWRTQGVIDSSVEDGRASLIFYCGTGWRSSVGFLVASALGLRAKNYDDGFYGWSHAQA